MFKNLQMGRGLQQKVMQKLFMVSIILQNTERQTALRRMKSTPNVQINFSNGLEVAKSNFVECGWNCKQKNVYAIQMVQIFLMHRTVRQIPRFLNGT